MKRLFRKIEDMLAMTALVEIEGIDVLKDLRKYDIAGKVERNLTAVAYTDEGEFNTARGILAEKGDPRDGVIVAPEKCQYADNDLCLIQG